MEWQLWIVHEENEPQIAFLWGSPLLHLPQCSAARGSSARREISERAQAQAAGGWRAHLHFDVRAVLDYLVGRRAEQPARAHTRVKGPQGGNGGKSRGPGVEAGGRARLEIKRFLPVWRLLDHL